MNELWSGIGGGAIADISPSRLEIAAVGTGTDLKPFFAAGSPDIDVIGLFRVETEVSGAELAYAIG